MTFVRIATGTALIILLGCEFSFAQETLEQRLKQASYRELAEHANLYGDPRRGAIVFYQPDATCTKCHLSENERGRLGPDLAKIRDDVNPEFLVQSILDPSHTIREGFQSVSIQLSDGRTISGLLVKETEDELTIRRVEDDAPVTLDMDDVDDWIKTKNSTMPPGLVNVLKSDQEFFDLLAYLIEISEGGQTRADSLEPPKGLYAFQPVPAYEKQIDHAGMIEALNKKSFERGKLIYTRHCANCHGTVEKEGSLPTSLRFAEGKFKNGSDPHSMYKTVTYGYGMMVRQHWMVPQQKYDVIHYIREAYLKKHNRSQFTKVDRSYLNSLPKGSSRGPKPTNQQHWTKMDYGPHLNLTLEQGRNGQNIAQKGIAIRMNPGPGGVSQGNAWMMYDHDTMRVAAAWTGNGFMDWRGINFNDQHNSHPRLVGNLHFANPTNPGWANPDSGSFVDPRIKGRDGRHYGPMPVNWIKYKGLYQYGHQTVLSYQVGTSDILELPGLHLIDGQQVWTRTLNVAPTDKPVIVQVAKLRAHSQLKDLETSNGSAVFFGLPKEESGSGKKKAAQLNGDSHVIVEAKNKFDLSGRSYSIVARIKTNEDGTIFSESPRKGNWSRDGKTFFVRNGRLCFDIGWVGAVQGRRRVADGKWHTVAMTWNHKDGQVKFYVDGKLDRSGELSPNARVKNHVLRIGYTSPNFPEKNGFDGEIGKVGFFNEELDAESIQKLGQLNDLASADVFWDLASIENGKVKAQGRISADGTWVGSRTRAQPQNLLAQVIGLQGKQLWSNDAEGNLRLTIPASSSKRQFVISLCQTSSTDNSLQIVRRTKSLISPFDLSPLTKGGPRQWSETLSTKIIRGENKGPFAVDVFVRPEKNPWDARLRLTGVDFVDDGYTALACSWDGSVWRITGFEGESKQLQWQRIAHGMFQPLGIKVVGDSVFVSCRDQIVRLHDLNDDHEIDYYECFNSDHQVTEHFHEFAMGLQADSAGNLYYAKSARHALKAVVPHHGTLLKVSKDGRRTEILANGFRAANGVCLNDDGSFIVTDQEGHWNPKNRINWVKPGGFYGNMFGYHDVTDSSDDAMDPPLCWITNSFDRSPSELLWVKNAKWGPLNDMLLNFSYGYGKIYVVPHEEVGGLMQGGMCELPLPRFPTGIMRGRFNKMDGQLYACGMFAWGGDQHQPGGFYRIRYTGQDVQLPTRLHASTHKMTITFSGELDSESVAELNRYRIKVWGLKRSANYGSKHVNERTLKITSARLLADRKSIELTIPDLSPTWCMEIKYSLKSDQGHRFTGTIQNTIHKLRESR